MTAKEYLQQVQMLDNLIECQLEELERLKQMLTRVSPVLDREVGTGGGYNDKIASGVAKIVDMQESINRNVDAYAERKDEAMRLLQKMHHPEYVKVLHKRYFLRKTWEEIAAEMQYSYRGACYVHGRALQEFEGVMKTEEITDANEQVRTLSAHEMPVPSDHA